MTPNNGLVSICPGSCAPWQTIKAFAASEGIDEESLTFFAPPSSNPSLLLPGSASAALCCASSSGQSHNREALAVLAKLLKPGSKVYVHDAALVRFPPGVNEATLDVCAPWNPSQWNPNGIPPNDDGMEA